MELYSKKKSKQDSMMRSKSFYIQGVREIGQMEVKESRGFPILWMRTIKNGFQMEEKECKVQERFKM